MGQLLHRIEYHLPGNRELIDLLYEESLYDSANRPSFRRDATKARWALDLRKPLSCTHCLVPTAKVFLASMRELGVTQVAGKGLGAFLLVGAIVALGANIRGCMIRESRKRYGFREIIEGSVDREKPLALVDDLIASGATVAAAADTLRDGGYMPIAAITVFRFGWQSGFSRLEQAGMKSVSLATLHYLSDGQGRATYTWKAPTIYQAR